MSALGLGARNNSVHTHKHIRTHAHTYIYAETHRHMHTDRYMQYTPAHRHTRIYAETHIQRHTQKAMHRDGHMHTPVQTHNPRHSDTWTYIYTLT